MPRFSSSPASRFQGNPLPYRSTAIMTPADSSHFTTPAPRAPDSVKPPPQNIPPHPSQPIYRRRVSPPPLTPHEPPRIALRIALPAAARIWTRISRLQGLVRNPDLLCPAIRGGTV